LIATWRQYDRDRIADAMRSSASSMVTRSSSHSRMRARRDGRGTVSATSADGTAWRERVDIALLRRRITQYNALAGCDLTGLARTGGPRSRRWSPNTSPRALGSRARPTATLQRRGGRLSSAAFAVRAADGATNACTSRHFESGACEAACRSVVAPGGLRHVREPRSPLSRTLTNATETADKPEAIHAQAGYRWPRCRAMSKAASTPGRPR
jgi:hypothetical protein